MSRETLQFVASGARRAPTASDLDIVFVHGLEGNRDTWRAGESFWPDWVAEEFTRCNVYVAEYESAKFGSIKKGPGASFHHLASPLIEALLNRAVQSPVVFVAHSLGGIVVKQLIRTCHDSSNAEYGRLAKAVKGVAFVATPHYGAEAAEAFDIILRETKSTVTKELAYAAPDLVGLANFFRGWAPKQSLEVRAFYETEHTWSVHVVNEVTANPNLPGVELVAIQRDHIQIAKPVSRTDTVCGTTARMIRQILEAIPAAAPSEPVPPSFAPEGLDLVPRRDDVVMSSDQLSSFGLHTSESLHLSVEGISGSGKTVLVSHWLRLEASQGRWKRVIWHDSYGGVLLEDIAASVADLSIDPRWSQRAKARALLNYLERSNSILVIDDFHQVNIDDFSDLIEEACGRKGPCRIVTIGQAKVISPRSISAVRNFTPEHFTIDQVDAILSNNLRRQFTQDELKRLHEVTDGLPFAVTLFCMLVSEFKYSIDQLLSGPALLSDRLEDWCRRAIDRLDKEGQRLVLGLSLIDGAVDFELVDVVGARLGVTARHRAFQQMVSAHLFRKRADAVWIMHSILAGYCRRNAPQKERRDVLLVLARTQRSRGQVARAPAERVVQLVAACRYLIAAGDYKQVETLLSEISRQGKRLGQHRLMRSLLSLFAEAVRPGLLPNWSGYHYVHCLFVLGDLDEAERYLKLLQQAPPVGDNDLRLSCQRLAAEIQLARGKAANAHAAIQIGDQIREKYRLRQTTQAQFLGVKFNVLLALRRTAEAEKALNEVLEFPVDERDRLQAGVINMHRSLLRSAQALHAEALSFAEKARKDFQDASDTRGLLWADGHIGWGQLQTGDDARGLEHIRSTALKLAEFGLPPHNFHKIAEIALEQARTPEEAARLREFLGGPDPA